MIQTLVCGQCNHRWEHEVSGHPGQIFSVQCPECRSTLWRTIRHPPLHLIISVKNGQTCLRPSRPASRNEMLAATQDVLSMLSCAGAEAVLHPDECPEIGVSLLDIDDLSLD